jgi:arylsulfatase A-like enzyme
MNKLKWISAIVPSVAAAMSVGTRADTDTRPNVVLIVSDDQGYGDMSCMGNTILKTPNLDRLYHQSTRLTSFIVPPVCAPTRAQLLTGRYNYRTGVWDTWQGRQNINPDEVLVARVLQENGYRTAAYGKWDTGYNYPIRAMDQGFDETVIRLPGPNMNPTMLHNGEQQQYEGFVDDAYFDEAINFIEQNADRPFFAYIASILPHDGPDPEVPPEYVVPFESEPSLKRGDKSVYGMVSKLDENVGRVLRTLERLGLEKNTVVIYLSDNGPLTYCPELKSYTELVVCEDKDFGRRYNCGLRGGKMSPYEGGVNTPCFIKWPQVLQAGKDVSSLTAAIDIFPTILDLCGVNPPENVKIDGISLYPLLTGETDTLPERTIFIDADREAVPQMYPYCSVVRDEKYTLVSGCELYDLENDPGQIRNIAAEHPEIVDDMREKYEAWFKDVTAGGFVPGHVIIGSPRQEKIALNMYFRHAKKGWPVKAVHEGPYKVTIRDIQQDLFPKGGQFCVRFGDKVYRKPFDKNTKNMVFDGIRIEKTLQEFDVWAEGYKETLKLYYGNEDLGFREVIVELDDAVKK